MSGSINNSPRCPYIGLIPYSEADADFFFGREDERGIIRANLFASRLTLLYGQSGVGKSSVLRAGVAYHLRQESKRNQDERGVPELAVVYFNSWTGNPLIGLVNEVRKSVSQALNKDVAEISPVTGDLDEILEDLAELVGGHLLIILDQFEEYFQYQRKEDIENTFAHQFPKAVNRPDLRANFLISIRGDTLAKLDRFKGAIPELFENRYQIRHLSTKAARAAIKEPIEKYNRLYALSGKEIGIEPSLVDAVLEQVETGQDFWGETGKGAKGTVERLTPVGTFIETPYLQLVMTRLWNEEMGDNSQVLRLDTLTRLGGAQNIVRTHLDAVMNTLTKDEQEAAARAFYQLVPPSGTKIAHKVSDLMEFTERPQERLLPLLEKLSGQDTRILRPIDPPPGKPATDLRYEIFHDVLAEAILDWRRRYVQEKEKEEIEKRMAMEAAEKEREALRKIEVERQHTEEERTKKEEQAKIAATFQQLNKGLRLYLRMAIVAFVLVVVLGGYAAFKARQARIAEGKAKTQALATAAINQARTDPELGVLLALHSVEAAKPLGGDSMREAMDALGRAINPARLRFTKKLDGPINKAALSPDQKRLVVALDNGELQVLKWPEGREEMPLQGRDAIFSKPKFAPTGKLIGAIASDKTVRIWNVETGILQHELTPPGTPVAVDFSADGSMIAIGGVSTAWVWRLGDKNPFLTLPGHKDPRGSAYTVTAVAFHPHPGKPILATAAQDETIRLWNLKSGKQVTLLQGHTAKIDDLEFSPDGQELLSACQDFTARIWDVATVRNRVTLSGHSNSVFSASYSRDGRKIVTASADATARIWDAESGREIVILSSHTEPVSWARFAIDDRQVMSASWDGTVKTWNGGGHIGRVVSSWFSPDGSTVATAGQDRTIRLWAAESGDEQRVLTGHLKPLTSMLFSYDGMRLASGDVSGRIEVWEPSTGKNVASLCCHSDGIESIAFSPDGSQLVSAAGNDGVALWNFSGRVQKELLLETPSYSADHVAFSPDGRWIAAGTTDGTVMIWNTTGPREVREWRAHNGGYFHVFTFSPDSKMLMTATEDHLVKLWWKWDVQPGKIRHEMPGHKAIVMSGLFVPDCSRIITSDLSGEIIVWDTGTGDRLEGPLRAHKRMSFLELSRDGTRLLSFSWDRTAKVWDTKSWRELATITHSEQINQGAISPDGMRVATASPFDGVRIVPLDTAELVRFARTRVTRDLKPEECLRYLQREDCPPLPR